MPILDRALWLIETHMSEPLDLARLADLCAVSPWHLARVFRAETGLSPVAYLRARRLAQAARQIAGGADDILTVALDAQYGSHEAFARAFLAAFGIPPSRARQPGELEKLALQEPLHMDTSKIVAVDAPRIEDLQQMTVTGLAVDTTFENAGTDIPPLWAKLNARADEIRAVGKASFGVCFSVDAGTSDFSYLAGFETTQGEQAPTGMKTVDVPPGRYAVFTHRGHISGIGQTTFTIWNKSLPDLGLTTRPAPDFERYDRRFNPETGQGEVEIWIPVED